ncbi:MAG: ABC transporter ATP-binding protein [Bacteroidota bacterium]
MIRIKNLEKIYSTEDIETTAVNKININIERGEFIAIMGPSGCGKSSLLNILGMLDRASAGEYWFGDEEVSNYSESERSRLRKGNIGFVFQSFNLIDELSVYQNVELPLSYVRMPKAERREKIEAALARMQIIHRKDHHPPQLSGGQQQRVAIARAIVTNPKVILADEPTGNLDSANGKQVMELLAELNRQGTTIIMVTHSDKDAQYANRIINLFDGKVVTEKINSPFKVVG